MTLFEDGGLTICGGKWTNMSPEEVKAMNEDFKLVAALTYADKYRLEVVIRDNNSSEDDTKELIGNNEYKLPKDWEYTKEDFSKKGFGIIHARNKIAEIQIYVDDVNPVKEFKANVLIVTDNSHDNNTFISNVERTVLVNLSAQKGEPYKIAKELLENCIKKVRNV